MSTEAISGAKTTSTSANRLVAEEDASLVAAAKARDTRAFELLAIELRDLGELSTGETALVMGLSVAAVKGRVFHGRKKLRETLSQSPRVDRSDHK